MRLPRVALLDASRDFEALVQKVWTTVGDVGAYDLRMLELASQEQVISASSPTATRTAR